ncbi:hypothetical protein L3Q82_005900 [Scortum barcoo]|uniref:Uncharacterized protein n=1 Tax=Scortum barcoo TaxID=214431 RepID=A0ACB8V732_9TELE|nr:hypothetical protein L3Q82_005900 [Scortum barcoo]
MKCFERIVLKHIKDIIPAGLDQYHQFAYRENRSTEDAVSIALHTALTHLQLPNTYVCEDAICGLQLSLQHSDPRQADTEAPQPGTALIAVPLDQGTSSPTGLRCDCSAIHSTNTKFADDTTVVGLISDNDETHYREEIQHLTQWCSNNNLVLNTIKTKEVIVDYRRSRRTEHAPLLIHGEAVERVNNIKFLGIHITSDLIWSMNTAHLLAVNGGALSQRNIADTLAVGRRVDVPTRWNSTYYMMQSLMKQKRALSAYAADYELPATLNETQWGILEKMTNLLEPFEQLTKDISSAEATAADVIPAVMSLTRLLSKTDDKGVPTA